MILGRAFRNYRNGYKSYADSKLYTSLYFRYLSSILRETKIKVASLHPGVVPGALYRHVFLPFKFLINNFLKFFIRSFFTPKFETLYCHCIFRDGRRAAIEILNVAFNDNIRSGLYFEHFRADDFNKKYTKIELRRLYDAVQVEIK